LKICLEETISSMGEGTSIWQDDARQKVVNGCGISLRLRSFPYDTVAEIEDHFAPDTIIQFTMSSITPYWFCAVD
jgi:hypothetical protein